MPYQNCNFIATCIVRGPPMVEEMRPAVPGSVVVPGSHCRDGEGMHVPAAIVAAGLAKDGVLVTLNISQRNSRFIVSRSLVNLLNEMSNCRWLGPRSVLRPTFPQ